MQSLSRYWFNAAVQIKFLLVLVPLTIILTVASLGMVQLNAGRAAKDHAISQFDEVGRSAATALSDEFWNYNVTQAKAILESLLLIPEVIQVSTIEYADGVPIEGSGFQFEFSNPRMESEDSKDIRTVLFPILEKREVPEKETVGQLSITYSLDDLIEENRSHLIRTLFASIPTALALIIGTSLALNYLLLRPILEVTRSSEAASHGKITETDFKPIVWNSGDQLGVLVSAFNDLRLHQIQSTNQLKKEQGLLQQRSVELEEVSKEARQARDEAIEANESKSRFLAVMSHELRTPLNTIIGLSDVIEKNYERLSPEKRSASLGRVKSAGRHLLSMINEILDLSKIEAGKMELENQRLRISEAITESVSMAETLASKNNNTIDITFTPELPDVWGDPTRIRQIILNLLSNAAKFTDNDTIEVSATSESVDAVNISVKDNGIGMDDEQMSRLFQDFQQAENSTSRKYGGTGLGLSISRKLARNMKGDITLTSSPGEGSCFTIRLPAYSGQDLASESDDDNNQNLETG